MPLVVLSVLVPAWVLIRFRARGLAQQCKCLSPRALGTLLGQGDMASGRAGLCQVRKSSSFPLLAPQVAPKQTCPSPGS